MPRAAPADSKSMAVKRDWWMSFMGDSRIKNQESRIKRRGGRKKRRMRRLFSVARVSRALHFFNVRLTKDSAPRGLVALPFFKGWD
jgi:hypothetical protein